MSTGDASRRAGRPRRFRRGVWFGTVNLNKDMPGTLRLIAVTLLWLGVPGVLGTQEEGHGETSCRLRGRGRRIRNRRRVELGRTGVHRWAEVGEVRLCGATVTSVDVHALHRATSGYKAQRTMYDELVAYVRQLEADGALVVVLGDLNNDPNEVAAMLGGTAFFDGVEAVIVLPGLRIVRGRVSRFGIRRKWTDHAAVKAYVVLDTQAVAP